MTSTLEKSLRLTFAVIMVVGLFAVPVHAADSGASTLPLAQEYPEGYWKPLAAIGAGLVTMGGAAGIGKLAASAMEGTARQPEAGGQIRTSMIIAAALIEGFTFFALIVCIMAQ